MKAKLFILSCLLFSLSEAIRLRDSDDDIDFALYADTIANHDQDEQNKIKKTGEVMSLVKKAKKMVPKEQTLEMTKSHTSEVDDVYADAEYAQ